MTLFPLAPRSVPPTRTATTPRGWRQHLADRIGMGDAYRLWMRQKALRRMGAAAHRARGGL